MSNIFFRALGAIIGHSESKAFRINEIEQELEHIYSVLAVMEEKESCPDDENMKCIINCLRFKRDALLAEAESL